VPEIAEAALAQEVSKLRCEPAVQVGHVDDRDPQVSALVEEEEPVRVGNVEGLGRHSRGSLPGGF
jgi:hypothetical protein